jgi:hypothetical protein
MPEDLSLEEMITEDTIEQSISPEVSSDDLARSASQVYNQEFFHQFAIKDKDMMLRSFEEYISRTEEASLPLLAISMIRNSYTLNSLIPNAEMVLYQLFMSPRLDASRQENEKDNLLAGNIFKINMTEEVYLSILNTLSLTGKKKHLKKCISHL